MKEKIIIPLDFDSHDDAQNMVNLLEQAVFFKVGLQAFLKYGEKIISHLKSRGKKLFLDLKFKDIPNTVAGAIDSSLKYSPSFLTIHLTGGAEMVKRAVEAAQPDPELTILGVTILTSLSNEDLVQVGSNLTTEEAVLRLCDLGLKNGIKAFVCSPLEVEPLRKRFGKDMTLVTPGIRPIWSVKGDQKRIFTPEMAVKAGSDFLVIGRPITKNPDPSQAFERIIQEIL